MSTSTKLPRTLTRQAGWILLTLGILHIPLVAFHFAFPVLFDWKEQLPRLSSDNAGLMLCLNACVSFVLGSMGAITLADGIRQLLGRDGYAPHGLWLWMGGFYLFRAVAEIPSFGAKPENLVTIALMIAVVAAYLLAWKKLAPEELDEAETPFLIGTRIRGESWLR